MKFVERVLNSLSEGHNSDTKKIEEKLNSDKHFKYTSREYTELCRADARRNLVIWSR